MSWPLTKEQHVNKPWSLMFQSSISIRVGHGNRLSGSPQNIWTEPVVVYLGVCISTSHIPVQYIQHVWSFCWNIQSCFTCTHVYSYTCLCIHALSWPCCDVNVREDVLPCFRLNDQSYPYTELRCTYIICNIYILYIYIFIYYTCIHMYTYVFSVYVYSHPHLDRIWKLKEVIDSFSTL